MKHLPCYIILMLITKAWAFQGSFLEHGKQKRHFNKQLRYFQREANVPSAPSRSDLKIVSVFASNLHKFFWFHCVEKDANILAAARLTGGQ